MKTVMPSPMATVVGMTGGRSMEAVLSRAVSNIRNKLENKNFTEKEIGRGSVDRQGWPDEEWNLSLEKDKKGLWLDTLQKWRVPIASAAVAASAIGLYFFFKK
eukprot:Platyproteum_vivax@DN6290_c1_g2_i3.p1